MSAPRSLRRLPAALALTLGVALGVVPLAAGPAFAVPTNDEIGSPTTLNVVAGTNTAVTISNVSATSNGSDPIFYDGSGDDSDSDSTPCFGHATTWYKLAVPSSGRLVVTVSSLSAGFDAAVKLFKASGSVPSYSNVTAVDPAYPARALRIGNTDFNTSGTLEIDAVTSSGGPYVLGLAGCDPDNDGDSGTGVQGTASLTTQFIARPTNDPFASASNLLATQTADVRGATTAHEANEPLSYQGGSDDPTYECYGGSSIWYAVQPGVGHLEVTTADETFSSVVSLMSGTPSSTLGALDVIDRQRAGGDFDHADLQTDTVAGKKYWVRVEYCNVPPYGVAPLAELGSLTLASSFVAAPANDGFATPTALSGASGTAAGDNTGATAETGEPFSTTDVGTDNNKSVWYSWTLPASGDYVVSTSGAPFNTILGIGQKASAISGFSFDVAQDDDVSLSNLTSRVQFTGTSGEKLLIRVSGVDDGTHPSTGAFTLTYGPAPDQVAPTASIKSPAAGTRVLTTQPFKVAVGASDAKSGVAEVHIAVTGLPEQVVTTPVSGSYVGTFDLTSVAHNSVLTISAFSVDKAGNESPLATRKVVADDGKVHSGYCGSTKGIVKATACKGVSGAKGATKKKTSWTSSKKGSTITVKFVGKQVDLYLLASKLGGKASITLDGRKSSLDLGSSKTTAKKVTYTGLNMVSHVLVITNLGTKGKGSKGTVVQLDKLRVYDPS